MKFYVKTAGMQDHQEYAWYEVDNERLVSSNREFEDYSDVNFKLDKKKQVSLFIKVKSKKRKDQWSRHINNYLLLIDDTLNPLMCHMIGLYLFAKDDLSYLLDQHIIEEGNNGRIIMKEFLGYFLQDYPVLEKPIKNKIVDLSDKEELSKLYHKILTNDNISVVDKAGSYYDLNRENEYYLINNVSTIRNEYNRLKGIKNKKESARFIVLLAFIMTIVKLIKKGRKNGK